MADVNELFLKAGIDTSQFDSSMRGMQVEIKKLKGLIGNNLLSSEEQKQVLTRMASLKDEIRDIQEGTSKVKGFELLARGVGGLAAGIGAITGTMKLFGVESEALNKTMAISNVVMSASIGIQQVLELSNLKTAIATKAAAAATWVLNNALKALVIFAVISAFITLVGWLYKYNTLNEESIKIIKDITKAQKDYNDELDKTNKSYKKKLEEQNDILRETSETEKRIRIENADFYKNLETLTTLFVIKQQRIRQLSTLSDEEIYKLLENANKLHNLNVENITNKHQQVLTNIEGIALKERKKEQDKNNIKIQTDEQKKNNNLSEFIKDKIKKEIDDEKEKDKELTQLEKDAAAAHKKVEDNAVKNAQDASDERFRIWLEGVKKQEDLDKEYLNSLKETSSTIIGLSQNMFGSIQTAANNFWITMSDKNATFEEQLKATLELLSSISNEIFNQINQNREQQLEKDLENLNKSFEKEYEDLENLKDRKIINDAEYNKRKDKLDKEKAKKEKELKTEAFKKEKEAKIIQAIINTALAVTMGLAQGGIAMGIIAGVLGALEIAYIASQPTPEFKKGGVVPKWATGGLLNGPSHEQGGIPIIAEGGERIFSVEKSRQFAPLFDRIQNNQLQPNQIQPGISGDDMMNIATAVTRSIAAIPVENVESESTRVRRKVENIESKATWG